MRFEPEVLVTPTLAQRWLDTNRDNNRKPKSSKVSAYARDIKAGRWLATGEAIKFDTSGRLMDGQNRLLAVIEADTAVTFSVFYDLDPASMLVMDTGAARSFGDSLAVNYGTPNKYQVGSIVRWVLGTELNVWRGTGGGFNPTHAELALRYDRSPLQFDASGARGRDVQLAGLGVASAAGTAHFLFDQLDAEKTKVFFDALITGVNLPAGHPALSLNKRLTRSRYDGLTRQDQLSLFIRAWNAFRADTTIFKIPVSNTGILTNENFPRPR